MSKGGKSNDPRVVVRGSYLQYIILHTELHSYSRLHFTCSILSRISYVQIETEYKKYN